ncbi:MAG TPA: indolepyruvate oxidoreductase subunit beta [Deltaproteobacteria bacterium]|nr:indolepyruvate oxidoreductase subunit beta [Deltaproteobacteria bacterium]
MYNTTQSVLLAGVGGQGILRASDILSLVLMEAGFDAKKSEVHGMAQRGGCVTSHVRYGTKVYSPIAKKHDINILVSFEKIETLRYLDYLKPTGKVIVNEIEIYPPSVNLGEAQYPSDIIDIVKNHVQEVKVLNATEMALKAGNPRTANIVLLGALSSFMTDINDDCWERVLRKSFTVKVVKANLDAFELGRNL